MGETQKPLAGVKVVELGTLIAGPFCTRILAEFGAEVIMFSDLQFIACRHRMAGPELGAHTGEILAALGHDAVGIAGLRAAGAI